jgi:hypothetical protein
MRAFNRFGMVRLASRVDLDDLRARVERGRASPMDRMGLARQLHSDLEAALSAEFPDWPLLKAIHRAWVESSKWAQWTE